MYLRVKDDKRLTKNGGKNMWSRSELKERAKKALSGTYWKAFGISLLLTFFGGGTSGGGGGGGFNFSFNDDSGSYGSTYVDWGYWIRFLMIFLAIFMFIFVIAMTFGFFLSNPLMVGIRKYFLEASVASESGEDVAFGIIGYSFTGNHYLSIVKSMIRQNLYLIGWTLLFIIPGIVKGYAYAMVPYILADNPEIGSKRAIDLSNKMTDGEKWNMFVLDLSFIGWYLLGMLPCFLGIFFVNPYYNATHAELYRTLRQKALDQRMCSYEELNFRAPNEQPYEEIEIDYSTEF